MHLILGTIMTVAGPLVRGLVLVKLWQWFMVGQFGLKPLSIPEALGISVVVSLLTYQSCQPDKRIEEQPYWGKIFYSVVLSLIMMLMGWIYHLFL